MKIDHIFIRDGVKLNYRREYPSGVSSMSLVLAWIVRVDALRKSEFNYMVAVL